MRDLTIVYTAADGGSFIDWPDNCHPRMKTLDALSLGGDYIQWPFHNGVEHIHAILWIDSEGEVEHRWDVKNGWTKGGS